MLEHIFLDFDGTIVVYEDDQVYFHPAIITLLNSLPGKGIHWHSNSGRSLEGQIDILHQSARRGLENWPATLCCGESYIYENNGTEYASIEPWNTRAARRQCAYHSRLQRHLRPHISEFRQWVAPDNTHLDEMGTYFFLHEHDPAYPMLCAAFRRIIDQVGDGHLVKNGGWLFAIPHGICKGGLVNHCAERKGWNRQAILAVGDHENDLSMVDGSSAGQTGCPANAIPEVKQAVVQSGGHVAERPGPLGTHDVIRHHLANIG